MRENDGEFKFFRWLAERFGFSACSYEQLAIGAGSPIIKKIGFSSPGLGWRDQLRGKLGKLGLGDPHLPIRVNAGLANVVPWNTETTQISTSNWPKDGFFLELEGCWYEKPPMDVTILSSEGGAEKPQIGGVLHGLSRDEQIKALDFVRENWPYRDEKK